MDLYRDLKSGVIIDSECILGGDWVPVEKQVIEEEHLTVVELKSSLDELGIHYEKNAKKSELLSLYKSHKG